MSDANEACAGGFKMPVAQPQHGWLQRLVGTWTIQGHGMEGWTETVRALGDVWVVAEGKGEMPGCGQQTTIMTLGYDPARDTFVGTFVASMMTHLWVYEGRLDGDRLVLDTVGPDMTGTGLRRYQDVIELHPDGTRELSSQTEMDDGWKEFMRARYSRA